MKSDQAHAFYLPLPPSPTCASRFESTPATAGPWSPNAQHGGPPAALLGHALEGLEPSSDRVLGRFSMDLLGPVPVGPLAVSAAVIRPGRSVSLREATLYDEATGRACAVGRAWAYPRVPQAIGTPLEPLPHTPSDGHHEDPPASWSRGYLDSVEWQWIKGAVTKPGDAVVWMRPRLPLLPDVEMSPWVRLLACVDSASGASAVLDPAKWSFQNTELTVQVLRPPVGEWVCLSARTTLGPGSVGAAHSTVHDTLGLVGWSAQTLLVTPAR